MTSTAPTAAAEVGPMLRQWRQRRGLSQLELALAVDSSARHLSFLENGRSRPSQAMLLKLAEHLDVPVRQRNALLVAAGYAPVYAERRMDAPEMGALREGLRRLLVAYEPYPALVFDGCYEVVAFNEGVRKVMLAGVDPRLTADSVNLMRVGLHPDGLAPRVVDFPAWRRHLLERMERQLATWPNGPLRELYAEVSAYPEVEGVTGVEPVDMTSVALPFRVRHEDGVLSFLTTATTFNTPLDVTVSELAIETFLPADDATARRVRSL